MTKQAIFVALVGTVACCLLSVLAEYEIEFQRVEQRYGEDLVDARNFRVRKFNRTTYAVNGSIRISEDLDNRYRGTFIAAYSRLGNNQFNEYPMKIPEQSSCTFLNGTYREYQYAFTGNHTNLPVVPPEGMCPLPKGIYWMKDFAIVDTFMPPVVPEGYWRITYLLSGPDGRNASFNFYLRLTRKDLFG